MSRLDYSKWDHIDISDDEDDTHPNIDTPSLFRWRHQARVEKMDEQKKAWEDLNKKKEDQKKKMRELEQKLKTQTLSEVEKRKIAMDKSDLSKQEEEYRNKEEELVNKDRLTPWNIDTICKDGFDKSAINKKSEDTTEKSEDDIFEEQKEFQNQYEKELKHFGMLSKPSDSRKYLQDHSHLITEKTANFLVIWCIDLEVEEKHSLMEQVAHQTIVVQFILQLATQMKTDPRNCYAAFFQRFETMQPEYMESFLAELDAFKGRIKERARIRIEEAVKKYEEEERQKELGPGGLHPGDVMETLPQELRECFESQDIPKLQQVILEMDPEDAKYHMKRCVDSGLWLPQGNAATSSNEEEEVYEEVEGVSASENNDKKDTEV